MKTMMMAHDDADVDDDVDDAETDAHSDDADAGVGAAADEDAGADADADVIADAGDAGDYPDAEAADVTGSAVDVKVSAFAKAPDDTEAVPADELLSCCGAPYMA